MQKAQYYQNKNKYDLAIKYYRKHLKNSSRDYQSWSNFGALYYEAGLPKRALRYLKRTERKPIDLAKNYYYQGLCLDMLRKYKDAEVYFTKAANFDGLHAYKAQFALAVYAFNKNETESSRKILQILRQKRLPRSLRQLTDKLIASLNHPKAKPFDWPNHPDVNSAIYRLHKYSLINFPHFWMVNAGFDLQINQFFEPDKQKGSIKQSGSDREALTLFLSGGLGPVRKGPTYGWLGYNYKQYYYTDSDRLKEYSDDFTDFNYQPFRFDLLERRHELYADVRRSFGKKLFLGLYGKYSIARIGSNFLGSSENQELRQVIPLTDTTLLIPWVGYQWNLYSRSLFYVYYRSEINNNIPEFSNTTINLTDDSLPIMNRVSFGLSHSQNIKEIQTDISAELFHYAFTYNDEWNEYERWGGIVGGEHSLLEKLSVYAYLGYYLDQYRLDIPKIEKCNPEEISANAGSKPISCSRDDQGFLIQSGIQWKISNFKRLTGQVNFVNNSSSLQEYENSKFGFKINYIIAFPSVSRVLRFSERFSDNAFTKEAE